MLLLAGLIFLLLVVFGVIYIYRKDLKKNWKKILVVVTSGIILGSSYYIMLDELPTGTATNWYSCGTAISDSHDGTQEWTNPTNVYSSNDVRAYASGSGSNSYSEWLRCTNFDIVVPDGHDITGVEVGIERSAITDSVIYDYELYLVKGGVIQTSATNMADTGTAWPTYSADAEATYGGDTYMWGVSLTESDIEDDEFGVALRILIPSDRRRGEVDYVRMRVYTQSSNTAPAYSSTGSLPAGVYKDGVNVSLNPVLDIGFTDADTPAASSMNISYYDAYDDSLLGYNDSCTLDKGIYTGKVQLIGLSHSSSLEYYAICNDSEDETQTSNFYYNTTDSSVGSQIFYFTNYTSNGGHTITTYYKGMNTTKPLSFGYGSSATEVYYYIDNMTAHEGNQSVENIYYHVWVAGSSSITVTAYGGLYNKGAKEVWSNETLYSKTFDISDNVSHRVIDSTLYRLYTGYIENTSLVIDGYTSNSYYYTYLKISSSNLKVSADVPSNTSYDNASFVIINPSLITDMSTDTDNDGYSNYNEMFTYYSDPFTANSTNNHEPTYEDVVHQGYDLTNETTSINPLLYVIFDDDDAPDESELTAYFYDNSDDSLIGIDTLAVIDKSIDGSSMYGFELQWIGLEEGTTYTYYVSVNDSVHNTTSPDISFTTSSNKHPYEIFYLHATNGSHGQHQSTGVLHADYHIINNTIPTVNGNSGCSNFYLYYFEDDDSVYDSWSYVDEIYVHIWRSRNESQDDEDTYANELYSEINGTQCLAWINGSNGYLYENTTSLAYNIWDTFEETSDYFELYCYNLNNTALMLDGTNTSNYYNCSIFFKMENDASSYPATRINIPSNTSYDEGSFIILNPPSNFASLDTDNDGYSDYDEMYVYYSNPFLSNRTDTYHEETVRSDGVDYFVWLGRNTTMSGVAENFTSYTFNGADTISILKNDGTWTDYTSADEGSTDDVDVHILDVIKTSLVDDTGMVTVNTTDDAVFNYDISHTFTLTYILVEGVNYTAFTNSDGSTLGIEADKLDFLDDGEVIAVWDDTIYKWIAHAQGTYINEDQPLSLWDVCYTRIENTEVWNQGD